MAHSAYPSTLSASESPAWARPHTRWTRTRTLNCLILIAGTLYILSYLNTWESASAQFRELADDRQRAKLAAAAAEHAPKRRPTTSAHELPVVEMLEVQKNPLLDYLFPEPKEGDDPRIEFNYQSADVLLWCMHNKDWCPTQNTDKVVILGSYHFGGALNNWNGGEDIWARSVIYALDKLGYTLFVSPSLEATIQMYSLFPEHTRAVLLEADQVEQCTMSSFTPNPDANPPDITYESCVLSPSNPSGIPVWKVFSFFFWVHAAHPFGGNWTLSPEDYNDRAPHSTENVYIGYSVEPSCRPRAEWAIDATGPDDLTSFFVPHENRPHEPPTAYVFTKLLRRFFPPGKYQLAANDEYAWSREILDAAGKHTNITYWIGAEAQGDDPAGVDVEKEVLSELPERIIGGGTGGGRVPQSEFIRRVASSKVLIGIGSPATSPTPYEALCLGVPFINPIMNWDASAPHDRTKWSTQHSALQQLDPPYVYNVPKGDKQAFVNAVKGAIEHPINSYILERMTLEKIGQRLQEHVLEKDLRAAAIEHVKRKAGDGGEINGLVYTL